MDICSICFDNLDNNNIFADCNKCKLQYHKECYNEFKEKLKFNCPICRNKLFSINYREINDMNEYAIFNKFERLIIFFTNIIDKYICIIL